MATFATLVNGTDRTVREECGSRAVGVSGVWQEFGLVFGGQGFGFGSELGLGLVVEFWRRSGADGDWDAHESEEFVHSGGGTDAEEAVFIAITSIVAWYSHIPAHSASG